MPVVESIIKNAKNSGHFPLSWVFGLSSNKFTRVALFKKSSEWISLAEFESVELLQFEIRKLLREKQIVIRGCDEFVAKTLFGHRKRQEILYGKEAILSLSKDHFDKKSVRELIKRGQRHGNVAKVEYSKEAMDKLEILRASTIHSDEPQLENLFIDHFHPSLDLFVFISKSGNWLAAITVSENSCKKLHTELLLRHRDAPIGVMEALIDRVFLHYKNSKFSEFSLGEVPFTLSKMKSIKFWNRIKIVTAGKIIRNAYNFEGLYNFKNKFNPEWNDIFLIGSPKLSVLDLTVLASKAHLLKLIRFKLMSNIRGKFGRG